LSAYAPFRLLIAAAAALVIATVIASSSAHAMLLGDAVLRSAPGAPLRVVIPLKPTPGEVLEAACFRLMSGAQNDAMVTAKVSLERAAATPRLIVTTSNAVADPTVRFAIEARCGTTSRRNYIVMLDPAANGAATRATAITTTAREPGQERQNAALSAPAPGATKSSAEPRPAPTVSERSSLTPLAAAPADASREKPAAASSVPAHAAIPPSVAKNVRTAVTSDDWEGLVWYLGAPLGMGAIALGILFATRHKTSRGMPDWTRGGASYPALRSRTDMSAQPVTLSRFDPTPMPKLSTEQRPDGASLRVVDPGIAANTLRRKTSTDVSTLDTLINGVSEADRQEDSAVREAWAAARQAVESEQDNRILRAIDEAERELLFVPPPPSEAAMDKALEDDLLSRPANPKKAAA